MVNKAQTNFRTQEKAFSANFNDLGIGVLRDKIGGVTVDGQQTTPNYGYAITAGTDPGSVDSIRISAESRDSAIKSYQGGSVRYSNKVSESVVVSTLCEADVPDKTFTTLGVVVNTVTPVNPGGKDPDIGVVNCGTGYKVPGLEKQG